MVQDAELYQRLSRLETIAESTELTLEHMKKQSELFEENVDRRFEEVDRRFNDTDRRLDYMGRRMESLEVKFDKWLMWIIGLAFANISATLSVLLVLKRPA